MKCLKCLATLVFLWSVGVAVAEESWQTVLGRMPLVDPAAELSRSNCVPLMLHSFRSNDVVKALIFMPGATDEIYFFKRAKATLTNAIPTLLDAVLALTNQTFIEADFRPPLLILHTTEDSLDGMAVVKSESSAAKLRKRTVPREILLVDADWDKVHSAIDDSLHIGLRPAENSPNSWHFYRHSFAAAGVTEWELLETLALAGKTNFTVHWLTADFVPDGRQGPTPKLDQFPR